MTTRHYGSCLCGAVRFEVDGAFDCFFLCHCSFCRKDTGSAQTPRPSSSLETPVTIRPDAHLFVASRANWDRDLETVPMLDRLPL